MFVVAGETIVDMIARKDAPMTLDAFLGGGPYNVAKAAAKMGQKTGYLSPLSQDKFGDAFLFEMETLGVQALAPRSTQPSGLSIVLTDENGHPTYTFHREKAADRDVSAAGIKSSLPAQTDAFYVGGLALAGGADADIWAEFVQSVTASVFVDPNVRPSFISDRETYMARLARVYEACDILKLSDEDIAWLAPDADPRVYFQALLARQNIAIGFLTFGGDGAAVFAQGQSRFLPSFKIQVQDTVGAGDGFSAACVAQILRGGGVDAQSLDTLENVLRYASTAAAINCTRAGANAPTHAEIEAFLQSK